MEVILMEKVANLGELGDVGAIGEQVRHVDGVAARLDRTAAQRSRLAGERPRDALEPH